MAIRGGALEESAEFDWKVTKRLLGYMRPHRRNIAFALGAMMFSVLATVIGPPLIGYAVDEGIRNNDMTIVAVGVAGYLFIQLLGLVGFRIQLANMATAGQSVIQTLRDELFERVQYQSIDFFSTYETGRLIARIISDVNTLREAITFAVVGSLRELLVLVGIIISMVLINLTLTIVSLVVLLILILIANWWRIHARKAYAEVVENNAKVNSELSEAFNGVRVTQAFNREGHNYRRFTDQINHKHREANVRASLIGGIFFPAIELVGGVATGALIVVGGSLVLDETLSVGVLLTFVLYIDQFFFPIRMLAQRYNLFQAVMAAGDKIFTLMDTPISVTDTADAHDLPQIRGAVTFEDVYFGYGKDSAPVLKGINLDIQPGQTVALVGHTGAGKSSLVKLVMRFYDITTGRLRIDGHELTNVAQRSLRRQMGVVLQETHLFSGTVMDNIRYGRLNATDEEVIEAAKAVGAHDFIVRLEHGYDSQVHEGGVVLSVGQRQLISFARALLADPRILILDEATSNIDTQTEKIIQSALGRLLKGRTSFVIAHRLSTIIAADKIVVMDHGEIVEEGSHQQLLDAQGVYHRLYTMA